MLRRKLPGIGVGKLLVGLKAPHWSPDQGLSLAEQTHPRAHRRSGRALPPGAGHLDRGERVAAAAARTARSICSALAADPAGQPPDSPESPQAPRGGGWQGGIGLYQRPCPAGPWPADRGRASSPSNSPPAAPGVARSASVRARVLCQGEPGLSPRFAERFSSALRLAGSGGVRADRFNFGALMLQVEHARRRAVASNQHRQQVDAALSRK